MRTGEDLLEEWKKDAAQFEPAPTRTKADEDNDLHSMQRELSRPLRLVVESKWQGCSHDHELSHERLTLSTLSYIFPRLVECIFLDSKLHLPRYMRLCLRISRPH